MAWKWNEWKSEGKRHEFNSIHSIYMRNWFEALAQHRVPLLARECEYGFYVNCKSHIAESKGKVIASKAESRRKKKEINFYITRQWARLFRGKIVVSRHGRQLTIDLELHFSYDEIKEVCYLRNQNRCVSVSTPWNNIESLFSSPSTYLVNQATKWEWERSTDSKWSRVEWD